MAETSIPKDVANNLTDTLKSLFTGINPDRLSEILVAIILCFIGFLIARLVSNTFIRTIGSRLNAHQRLLWRRGIFYFIFLLFIIGFGYSFVSITNWAVVADVIDYQEYKTGIKNESAVYAVYTFCRKLGQTAADYGGLMLLGKVGYDVQLMSNAGYVDGVSEGILKICTLIPAITYTLIFLLYQFAYPLSKSKLEPVYDYVRNMNCAAQSRETY